MKQTSPPHLTQDHNPQTPKRSGFGIGLSLGVLFGAAAYFLYSTPAGKKALKGLEHDFSQTKKKVEHQLQRLNDLPQTKPSLSSSASTPAKPSPLNFLKQLIPGNSSSSSTTSPAETLSNSKKGSSPPKKTSSKQFFTRSGKKLT